MTDDYTPLEQWLYDTGIAMPGEVRSMAKSIEHSEWLTARDAQKRTEWEAEQGKPAPCVMTHTPPFDFAQCETHDETFPLGGACKWHGKESITEVLQDEADEQRARAVRAEHELEMLQAEQGEPEWEYGYELIESDTRDVLTRGFPFSTRAEAHEHGHKSADEEHDPEYPRLDVLVVKRTKNSPWIAVPDTTNTESEGKA